MRSARRPRRYVSPTTLTVIRPMLRYSSTRDAYVLRVVGNRGGPVLRRDRRQDSNGYAGPNRRRSPLGG